MGGGGQVLQNLNICVTIKIKDVCSKNKVLPPPAPIPCLLTPTPSDDSSLRCLILSAIVISRKASRCLYLQEKSRFLVSYS